MGIAESHPEQHSECARLEMRESILSKYSRIGHNIHEITRTILDLRPRDDLLDIGCGLGGFIMELRRNGHSGRLVGIDKKPDLIEYAKEKAIKNNCHVEFLVCDFLVNDFHPASFDCVTSINSCSESSFEKMLIEAGRVLKVDGRAVFCIESPRSLPLLNELIEKSRQRFGWFLSNEPAESFSKEVHLENFKKYFGKAEEYRHEDMIQYPDAEILVQLFRAFRGTWNENLSDTEWERIVDWVRDQAIELVPEHGYAEDPRRYSFFRCSQPLGM